MDKNKKKILALLGGLLVMVLSTVIIDIFFRFILDFRNNFLISGFWVFSIFPLFLYILYVKNKKIFTFEDIGIKKDNIPKTIIIGLISGIIIGIIGLIFIFFFGNRISNISDDIVKLFIFRSVIFAPIFVEILIRGLLWALINTTAIFLLKDSIKTSNEFKKDIIVIIIVSFVFWFLHYNWNIQLLFTKILFDAFAFSFVFYKTKNLIAPILAHSITNLFVLLPVFIF
jgi:membrane protease YdiL (CAAX protease family)